MSLALAPHIHVAEFGERAVVLDLRSDRYRLIGGELAQAIGACSRGEVLDLSSSVDRLTKLGWIDRSAHHVRLPLPELPTIGLTGRGAVTLKRWHIAWALLAAEAELRLSGLSGTLDRTRDRIATALEVSDEAAADLAGAYGAARPAVPIRRVCLRDSLALMRIFAAHAARANLIIGVRIAPFAAHCWVQHGSMLLNDDPYLVSEYTPILAL